MSTRRDFLRHVSVGFGAFVWSCASGRAPDDGGFDAQTDGANQARPEGGAPLPDGARPTTDAGLDSTAEAGEERLATSLTQHGITWTWREPRRVGQYANGDYWVVGPSRSSGSLRAPSRPRAPTRRP